MERADIIDRITRNPKSSVLTPGKIPSESEHLKRAIDEISVELSAVRLIGRNAVVTFMENGFEQVAVLLAMFKLRIPAVPVSSGASDAEVRDTIIRTCAAGIISNRFIDLQGIRITSMVVREVDRGKLHIQHQGSARDNHQTSFRYPKGTCQILLTSGTTGVSKCVVLSRDNVTRCVQNIVRLFDLSDNDRVLIFRSLSHVSGLNAELLPTLAVGADVVFSASVPVPTQIARVIQDNGITVFFCLPELLAVFWKFGLLKELSKTGLRILAFYGSPAGEDLVGNVLKAFPPEIVHYGYGQTEATSRVTSINGLGLKVRPTSSGSAVKDVDLQINNPDIDGYGEICVHGPTVCMGYIREGKTPRFERQEGWLKTGDVGRLDEEGFLHIRGRMDDMIVRNGNNIFPAEIENALVSHQSVLRAKVYGERDEQGNPKLVALVEACPRRCIDVVSLRRHILNSLGILKVPNQIEVVSFSDGLDKKTRRSKSGEDVLKD